MHVSMYVMYLIFVCKICYGFYVCVCNVFVHVSTKFIYVRDVLNMRCTLCMYVVYVMYVTLCMCDMFVCLRYVCMQCMFVCCVCVMLRMYVRYVSMCVCNVVVCCVCMFCVYVCI